MSRLSPAMKRLMKEAKELAQPTYEYSAQPLEQDFFDWHFTIRGPPDTDYAGGIYHGRIIFPQEYPMKPPTIMMLTPNGRFETDKRICLSMSDFHPESWQPSWSVRTVLLAIISFMPTPGDGAVGSLDVPRVERQKLAASSPNWKCPVCDKHNRDQLATEVDAEVEKADQAERAEAAKLVLRGERSRTASGVTEEPSATNSTLAAPTAAATAASPGRASGSAAPSPLSASTAASALAAPSIPTPPRGSSTPANPAAATSAPAAATTPARPADQAAAPAGATTPAAAASSSTSSTSRAAAAAVAGRAASVATTQSATAHIAAESSALPSPPELWKFDIAIVVLLIAIVLVSVQRHYNNHSEGAEL